jgi:hypothetical protein
MPYGRARGATARESSRARRQHAVKPVKRISTARRPCYTAYCTASTARDQPPALLTHLVIMAAHLLPSVLLPLLLLLALPLTAASLPPAQQQPAGWTTQRNKDPPKYGSHGPKKLPGKFSNSSLGPCFTACTAAHRSHSGCLGFTACSTGPIGCWLYSDVESGVLAPSPDCDWHAAPWVPQALCTRNCSMVTVAGPPGSYYHGTFNGPQGAAKEATTAAACVAACLAQTDCVQSTFSKRPAAPCVLYNSISNALSQTVQTVGSVKCKGGSTDASTCAFFSSGPPPGPPLPPVQPFPLPPPPPPPPPPATVTPHWDDPVASGVTAISTYLDQVNTVTMERGSKVHDAVFARIKDLQADHIRYLHWDPMPMSYPEKLPPKDGKTSWDFTNIDPYVEDFMANTVGHDSVINCIHNLIVFIIDHRLINCIRLTRLTRSWRIR